MDVKQIHNALITIWPGGIPREGLVYLAGMIKVIADKAEEGVGVVSIAQIELEQALATAYSGPDAVMKIGEQIHAIQHKTAPVAPKGRGVPTKILARIKSYLDGARLTSTKSRTQMRIAQDLELGPWAVKRAVWQLQREGAIVRVKAVQGPHLYQLAK